MKSRSKKSVTPKPKVAKRPPQESTTGPLVRGVPKGTHASHHRTSHESGKTRHAAAKKGARTRARNKLSSPLTAYEGCAVQAIADALFLSTGIRGLEPELEAMFLAAGGHPADGATMADSLAAAMLWPLAGFPRVAAFTPADPLADAGMSLLLGLDLTLAQADQEEWDIEDAPEWGPHAVAAFPGGVLSWGREIPVTARFLGSAREAWTVEWRT